MGGSTALWRALVYTSGLHRLLHTKTVGITVCVEVEHAGT